MEKEPWAGNTNFWAVFCGLSQFLARGNSCRKFFGLWWLVVINILDHSGSWWFVVARMIFYI